MNKETLCPNSSYTEQDQKDLKQLVETFGSVVSLQHITSAYSKAGKDLQSAADQLCSMKENTSNASASFGSQSSHHFRNGHTAKRKPIKCSASLGTVSNIIGKEYITPRTQSIVPGQKCKPVILTSDEVPASQIWDEANEVVANPKNEALDSDLEDFICKMLGDGFGLEKNVIHDVIGQCGYNISMSIDKLLDFSAVTMEKPENVLSLSSGKNQENGFDANSSRLRAVNGISARDESVLTQTEKSKINIQNEVLEALFSVPERTEEEKPRLKGPPLVESPYIVRKPIRETLIEDFSFITRQPVNGKIIDDEANEYSYEEWRASAAEYWSMMKEYYKAAIKSFGKKDYEKAWNLMENGHLYMNKAREADEKSAKKLVENSDDEDEMLSLNVYHLEPREAMRSFRVHLKNFSGLRSFHYLKAVIGTEDGGKKDKRRKKLITELLENEGIPWTEEGNGLIISVRVDVIDPTKLSFFAKK